MRFFILALLAFHSLAIACPTLEGSYPRCTVFGDAQNFPKISNLLVKQELLSNLTRYELKYDLDGVAQAEVFLSSGQLFQNGDRQTLSKCRGTDSLYVVHFENSARTAVFEYARIGEHELRFMAEIIDRGYVAVSCRR